MVKPIMKDVLFLSQKSEPATMADKQVARDLLDTLKAHEDGCVGMAANMIGVRKNIIAVNMGFANIAMFNPKIVKRRDAYQTEEGCLSLDGTRKCTRYREIEVEYQDMDFRKSAGKNHLKGSKKRGREDDVHFEQSFEKMILEALGNSRISSCEL